ncbi:hypothetical protein Chor_016540, partial [Crotalus horridus]
SRDVVCEPVKKLYSALPDNNSSVEIFNADGSRYVEGKKVTERPQVTEDDSSVGSGSAIGRGTTDPSDFIPAEENSNHGKHRGNSSQDQQITEDFPLWWPPEEPKGMQNTTSSEDQSFEDDDDGGGDDDEEGSGQKNPETVLEWDNSGDKELQSSNTTVNSSRDVKQEESTHGILLPAVHSGRDSEVRYSTNDTRVDVLPGIVLLGDDEQYSTTTAMSSSDDFSKQEDSKQPQLASAFPELEIEDTISPAINTSDMLHPEFSISDENENTLEKDPFHHPVTFFNGSVEHEEGHEHQPSAVDTVSHRSQSSVTNRTIHDIVQILVPPRDSYYENASSQSATVASKEKRKGNETTQNPLFFDIHPGLDNKNDLPENKTRDDFQSEIIQIERKPELETTQTAGDYEDSTQDSLIKEDPDLSEKLYHPTNSSINDLIPGISNLPDNVQENKTSHTVAIFKDFEDSAQSPLPPIYQPDWFSEEKHTNTSSNGTEISKQHENEHHSYEDVGFYGTKEDSTPEPVRQWVSEDMYTTKATMDVLFSGIVPRRGINQKNKTDHTVVASSDGDKNEKSDLGPEWHPTWTRDDENLVNNSQDPINRHPPSTDSPDPNKHPSVAGDKNMTPLPEGSGKSQPRMARIPDWLIVVASLLALALILGVCIAVNSRRRCGQKKKLVINNGKGGIDEKKKDGLNGEASKSQEMVHLVHKEKPEDQKGPHDEFQAIDETQNQQDVPLKSGM